MADLDSSAEVSQGEQTSCVPPESSCDALSPSTELQAAGRGVQPAQERSFDPRLGSQDGPGREEEEEEEGAERTSVKPRPPQIHLHGSTDTTLMINWRYCLITCLTLD